MSEDQKKKIAVAVYVFIYCLIYAACVYALGFVFGSLLFFGAIFIAIIIKWAESTLKNE